MKPIFLYGEIVKKKSASVPVILGQKHIYIVPNWYGLLFLLILFGMLIGSVNYNNNLGFLLTFLLGGMMLVGLFHTHKNLKGLHIISAKADPVFSGDIAVLECLVSASGHDRKAVSFCIKNEETISKDISIHTNNVINVPFVTIKRGISRPGPLQVKTTFPLGLFFSWSVVYPGKKCIVYPAPSPGPVSLTDDKSADHDNGETTGSGVEDFQELRGYQPGDSLQRVSWKTYSRGQGLYTKTFTAQFGSDSFFDWERIKIADTEKKLSAICYGILQAHRQKILYFLKRPGQTRLYVKGEPHKHRCLKALALYPNVE